jgi:2',3'-cyclic-nucleotide 2'-phosphodiesterase (5'-nucleotidase family)
MIRLVSPLFAAFVTLGSFPVFPLPACAGLPGNRQQSPGSKTWELRILHTSDQEAGKKALIDIPGMVAVMSHLDQLDYPNTLKLTSGDLFISGPFMDASQYLYSNPVQYQNLKPERRKLEPLALRPGIADIIINNGLGWHAAVIGNHEFDGLSQVNGILGKNNFFSLIAADSGLVNYNGKPVGADAAQYVLPGAGIGSKGYLGATFPYLSVNLDFDSFRANEKGDSIFKAYGLKNFTGQPSFSSPNALARSTIVPVGSSTVGVIGATTPFLPDIVGALEPRNMRAGSYRSKETSATEQAAVLKPFIHAEVAALESRGVNKIVLMTHLQDSAIEQELLRQLVADGVGVDVVIGGGSHKVMGPANGAQLKMLRGLDQSSVIDPQAKARQEVAPALIPYPQSFVNNKSGQVAYYVNGGANYEYLNQLVLRFDDSGRVIGHDPLNSRPWKTDEDGVIDLLGKHDWRALPKEKQRQLIKGHVLATSNNPGYQNAIAASEAVEKHINSLDSVQYGMSKVWLNGVNSDVRSRETNLGSLIADAMLWYGQELKKASPSMSDIESVDVAFITGGSIRDMIGTQQLMPDETVHRSPPEANPILGKDEGEISKLDVLNSLRFSNILTVGTISSAQLKRSLEAMVSEARHGGFGQVSGFRFRYDPAKPKGSRVVQIDLTRPYRLVDGRVDGTRQDQVLIRPLMANGTLVDPAEVLGLITLDFLAEGADGQAGAQLTQNFNRVRWVGQSGNATAWQQLGRPVPAIIPASHAPPSIQAGLSARQLGFGTERDALAAYLSANHQGHSQGNPFDVPDTGVDGRPAPSRVLTVQSP